MSNPFKEYDFKAFNFSEYLRQVFKNKKSGDIFKLDLNGHSIIVARATIKNIIPFRVTTKVDKETRELWVKVL